MEAEFEANKQQRGANLNKVTQHLRKAEMGNFIFFIPQRELSPSPPACSEPERLAGKTWGLVGESFFSLFTWFLVWFELILTRYGWRAQCVQSVRFLWVWFGLEVTKVWMGGVFSRSGQTHRSPSVRFNQCLSTDSDEFVFYTWFSDHWSMFKHIETDFYIYL